ncbi:MAG: RluA family pseudouridine synthase [Leptolyngbyaceae cyanobacterium bins.302]|nr:RluA family pseudouridine synthase [Leptolyngbyaceae cyanobacterium bins.302]
METVTATYWYEGRSPQTGEWLRLPRTHQVEACARELMQFLAHHEMFNREGKMYGVLLVENTAGEQQVLKAFSGLLNGESLVEDWVPPIPGRAAIAFAEAITLSQLAAIKQEIISLQTSPERSRLMGLTEQFSQELRQLAIVHQQRKHIRQQQRQILQETQTGEALKQALYQLDTQSQRDGIQRRRLKTQQNEQLQQLQSTVAAADTRIQALKHQRKQLSRQLQAQMQEAYYLTNFAGKTASLQQLFPHNAMPTGTGDCCAPKLLHYAATCGFKPLAMAEFWWGSSVQDDKVSGEFYGACRDRCQPLMGFLLSGIAEASRSDIDPFPETPVLYQDKWIVVVDKSAGLLSVPGRYRDRQDSVLSRLRSFHPELRAVHRLDQDTSGILLLARDLPTYRHLSQQFQARQVHKVYEAVLDGSIAEQEGVIELPLGADPSDRPKQKVDWQRGKPSLTKFRVLAQEGTFTRIEFLPLTGRTHQIRVHAADPQGLGMPIVGDRWYGGLPAIRLHLHAKELILQHPHTQRSLQLQSPVPF